MVVEGAARDVVGTEEVRVVAATGSGDDTIVELVRREPPGCGWWSPPIGGWRSG